MLLVTTSAGSTLSRAVCQSPARSFSLSCTTPHPRELTVGAAPLAQPQPQTPKTAGTELPHLTWRKAPRGRFAEKQAGVEERSGRKSLAETHSLFYQEAKCLENRPCPQPPAPRLESPLLVSSRGSRAVKLARSLLRTPLPFPCQSSGAAAALPPRGRAGDRHPVSPREHGRAQGPTAHPRHALPGDTAHPEQPEHRCSCKNINNKKFTPELPENFKIPSTHGTSRPE